jgi:hypothetical protein
VVNQQRSYQKGLAP